MPRFLEEINNIFINIGKIQPFFSKQAMKVILTISSLLLYLSLFIHNLACYWVYVGDTTKHGWIDSNPEIDNHPNKYSNAYI